MFFKYNAVGITWAVIILVLCGIPGNEIPKLPFLEWMKPDKIVHLFMFGILNYLLIKGFIRQDSFLILARLPVLYASIITILYGVLTEVLQATVFIGRTGDIRDAGADALGACCGIWIYNVIAKRKNASL